MLNLPELWSPATQQKNFRALLNAMSRPGTRSRLWGCDADSSISAVLAALMDNAVTLADLDNLIDAHALTLLQTNTTEPNEADYIVADGANQPSDEFRPKLGSLASPNASATIVLKVTSVSAGDARYALRGPGVDGQLDIQLAGFNAYWQSLRQRCNRNFPMGCDLVLVADQAVLALPRTTQMEEL